MCFNLITNLFSFYRFKQNRILKSNRIYKTDIIKKALSADGFYTFKTKCLFIRAFIFVFVLMNAALLFAFEAKRN